MTYADLRRQLEEYNWDDGFALPSSLARNPLCDLAMALELFYLGDGYGWMVSGGRRALPDWAAFIEPLYTDIAAGRYPVGPGRFQNPLTKVQRYRLRRQGIPEVFLQDLPSA